MVRRVDDIIKFDRRVTFDEMEKLLPLSGGTIFNIVHDHLKYSMICSRFVPRFLTPEMREARKLACFANLATLTNN